MKILENKIAKPAFLLALILNLVIIALSFGVSANDEEEVPERLNNQDRVNLPFADDTNIITSNEKFAPAIALPWTHLTFQSFRDRQWDIYISNDDGGELENLTNRNHRDIQPNLNRGGTAVVYAASENEQFEIALINLNSRQRVLLTNNSWDDVNPRWSPDGRQVAFESYQHGNADIFVMNADGTNVRQLTSNPEFDGMPTWAPDGSSIAFSSGRTGGYRIHRINIDGTNLQQLSNIPRSLRPRWSPDGTYIAFDAISTSDPNFQSVYAIKSDGSEAAVEKVTAYTNLDTLVSGWTPNGTDIVYSRLKYVVVNDQYYIDNLQTSTVPVNDNYHSNYSIPNNLDLAVDWQTLDVEAPSANIENLNPTSPAEFQFLFKFTDLGGSDIREREVQTRKGENGNWQNYDPDDGLEPWEIDVKEAAVQINGGKGGEKYYFRARAIDKAYNKSQWSPIESTTIESLPPNVLLEDQIKFVRVGDIISLSWSGKDPGLSGIKAYEAQYQLNSGEWLDIDIDTRFLDTDTEFMPEEIDGDYNFRVRAIDFADNQSEWVESGGSTKTYGWSLRTEVYDNTNTPIEDIEVVIGGDSHPILLQSQAKPNRFTTFASTPSTSYELEWQKDGFGEVGTIDFDYLDDPFVKVILPPQNDLIQNGDFESGDLEHWSVSPGNLMTITHLSSSANSFILSTKPQEISIGETFILPQENQYEGYLGDFKGEYYFYSEHFDNSESKDLTILKRSNIQDSSIEVSSITLDYFNYIEKIIMDPTGSVHILSSRDEELVYWQMLPSGEWKESQTLSPNFGTYFSVRAFFSDLEGGIHLFNQLSDNSITYAYKKHGEPWSDKKTFNFGKETVYLRDAFVDKFNRVHLGMVASSGYREDHLSNFYYTYKEAPDLLWQSLHKLETQPTLPYMYMFEGGGGEIEFFWDNDLLDGSNSIGNFTVYPDKVKRAKLPPSLLPTKVNVQSDGSLQLLGYEYPSLEYKSRKAFGDWTNYQLTDFSLDGLQREDVLFDQTGGIHLLVMSAEEYRFRTLYYLYRSPDGIWNDLVKLDRFSRSTSQSKRWLEMDSQGRVHIYWYAKETDTSESRWKYAVSNLNQTASINSISQTVNFPIDMQHPTLSFEYKGAGFSEDNTLDILVTSQTNSFQERVSTASGHWEHYWTNLNQFKGQEVQIEIVYTQAENAPLSQISLDNITLGSANLDLFVSAGSVTTTYKGQFVIPIRVGNHSGVDTAPYTFTVDLPENISLVSSTVEPDNVNGNQLIWLALQGGGKQIHEIQLTLQSSDEIEIGSVYFGTAQVNSSALEFEESNNSTGFTIEISHASTYLPIVNKCTYYYSHPSCP